MAFYEPDGDRYVSTAWTRGPWSPDAQHAGPPAALTGNAIDCLPSDLPMRVTRFTFEILKPVPMEPLRVDARVARPGKRVQMCEAALIAGEDVVAVARAWRMRVAEDGHDSIEDGTPPAAPDDCEAFRMPGWTDEPAYLNAMELRTVTGSPFRSASTVWFRMRHELIAGEQPRPLARVLAAADSGNGISAVLDFSNVFVNVDLTVHLIAEPAGEWVALESRTRIDGGGIGATETRLWDPARFLGTAAQSLYVQRA